MSMAKERANHGKEKTYRKRIFNLTGKELNNSSYSRQTRNTSPRSLLSLVSQEDCATARVLIALVVISVTSDIFLLRIYLHNINIPGPLITLALAGSALGTFRHTIGVLSFSLLSYSPAALKLIATIATLGTVLGLSLLQGKPLSWPLILILIAMTLIALQAHRVGRRITASGEERIATDKGTYPKTMGTPKDREELRSRLILALLCGPSIAARIASLGVLSWLPVTPELFPTYLASLFLVFGAAIADSAAIHKYGNNRSG